MGGGTGRPNQPTGNRLPRPRCPPPLGVPFLGLMVVVSLYVSGGRLLLIELQSHSTVSDGQLLPADVVAAAAEAGVTTLALTDHDAIAGVADAGAAAEKLGIELVPAIEMSCV